MILKYFEMNNAELQLRKVIVTISIKENNCERKDGIFDSLSERLCWSWHDTKHQETQVKRSEPLALTSTVLMRTVALRRL